MKKKKNSIGSTVLLAVIFLAGLSLLLYPTVSNYLNSLHQSSVIADYSQGVKDMDAEKYAAMRAEAQAYNELLLGQTDKFHLPEALIARYDELLDVAGNGIMGYVEIPAINCTLPIYHGTDEEVLQVAVGHLEWTSLPVGGENTHSVISGHRGLPSAELLTHIDKLTLGDVFYIHVLGDVLEYRVDDISIVLPEETSKLQVVAGEDYLTMVTCTPYGINSHRLLVRGTRVVGGVTAGGDLYIQNEIRDVELIYVIPVMLTAVVLVWGAISFLGGRKKKQQEEKQEEV